MSKTIRQIADEIGIPKQRVYRYIKNNRINESHQENGVMYYNEAAEMSIKQAFENITTSSETHQYHINDTVNEVLINMLKNELEIKNKQIESLSTALLAAQQTAAAAQALHAGTIKQLDSGELPLDGRATPVEADVTNKKNGFIARIFKKEKTG